MDELEKIFAELQLLFVHQRNQINELKSRKNPACCYMLAATRRTK